MRPNIGVAIIGLRLLSAHAPVPLLVSASVPRRRHIPRWAAEHPLYGERVGHAVSPAGTSPWDAPAVALEAFLGAGPRVIRGAASPTAELCGCP